MNQKVVIVGGGTAGLSVGAMLLQAADPPQVTIIEPSDKHYYQPIWTLVGAGVFDKEFSERSEADYIPAGATWIQEYVETFEPADNSLTLRDGQRLEYDVLVVAAGIQIDWDKVPGLKESVGKEGTGVCSNYTYQTVESTWNNLRELKKGVALFTHSAGSIKCGGAPMKIAFLAADYLQKQGLSNQVEVKYIKGGKKIFGVEKYIEPLNKVVDRYGIQVDYQRNLLRLHPEKKEAVFFNLETEEEYIESYDMIHVTPYQSAPDFIKSSPLANNEGWVEVDKFTTQHARFQNVFSLGDCSSLPTSKTGAAIRKQAPVTVANVQSYLAGTGSEALYDGYTSCPLVTGFGKLILAEFDYNNEPVESFPFDQAKERYSMYALKAYALPQMYWNGMLQGRKF
ncbi:MAG: NAD(P)/FAD-dependent oxidoreductase [Saprospiraceae bacterium]|nr:NAD(P)/FAD-dependent oxidoreductase [Saprospiraceae bacterium]